MERVKWIFALCMILCVGCGSQVESEPTPTPSRQWMQQEMKQ